MDLQQKCFKQFLFEIEYIAYILYLHLKLLRTGEIKGKMRVYHISEKKDFIAEYSYIVESVDFLVCKSYSKCLFLRKISLS